MRDLGVDEEVFLISGSRKLADDDWSSHIEERKKNVVFLNKAIAVNVSGKTVQTGMAILFLIW